MQIHTLPIGPLNANCYIVENGVDALIFDAPDFVEPVLEILNEKNLKVQAIICTHLHYDHVSGVADFIELTKAKAYAGKGDLDYKDDFLAGGIEYGTPKLKDFEATELQEGLVEYGSISCEQFSTPGHSLGGFCFYFKDAKILITGDTLFKHSIGRSDFFGGNHEQLIASIKNKLLVLPDDTKVYPGHAYPSTILEEKKFNPFLS